MLAPGLQFSLLIANILWNEKSLQSIIWVAWIVIRWGNKGIRKRRRVNWKVPTRKISRMMSRVISRMIPGMVPISCMSEGPWISGVRPRAGRSRIHRREIGNIRIRDRRVMKIGRNRRRYCWRDMNLSRRWISTWVMGPTWSCWSSQF